MSTPASRQVSPKTRKLMICDRGNIQPHELMDQPQVIPSNITYTQRVRSQSINLTRETWFPEIYDTDREEYRTMATTAVAFSTTTSVPNTSFMMETSVPQLPSYLSRVAAQNTNEFTVRLTNTYPRGDEANDAVICHPLFSLDTTENHTRSRDVVAGRILD